MTIVAQGAINTAAQLVPDIYVQIVPPQSYLIPGTATNVIGIAGTASWGPVNQPLIVSDMPDYVRKFGTPVPRKYDMGTHVATAAQQGAQDFRCVRVTDGTDTAATCTGVAGCLTFTALYTGSLGNALTVQLLPGSRTGSWRLIVGVLGGRAEVFDNISGSGNALWVALANAVNNGTGRSRPASQLIVASSGAGTTSPAATLFYFSGGADGGSVSARIILGSDLSPRSGMYALRGLGCSLGVPSDCDDYMQWPGLDALGLQESIYMILCTPSGDTINSAISAKISAGIDTWSTKLLMGDWLLWRDPFLQNARYVSPQGFVAGRFSTLSPEQSGLNKAIRGITGSQRSNSTAATYSTAELAQLDLAGIDVVTYPGAASAPIWTCRLGHNASSNADICGDHYSRLTKFIATSLNVTMGLYLGRPINSDMASQVRSSITAFLLSMLGNGLIGQDYDDGGLPFSVNCDIGNGTINPPSRTRLGFFQAQVQVQYMAINERFIVNIEDGVSGGTVSSNASGGFISSATIGSQSGGGQLDLTDPANTAIFVSL